jgi:cobalt-zinc-cadmium efflux system membrane fusion protein
LLSGDAMRLRAYLTAIGAVALAGCSAPPASEAEAPPARDGLAFLTDQQLDEAHLAVESPSERDIGREIVTSGRIAFDDLHVAHVLSPVTGRVTRIDAQLGKRVKKGEALAVIESPDLGMASADVEKAHADLVAAEHELARQKELVAAHAGTQRDLEAAEDAWRKAKAEMQRAQQRARLFNAGGLDAVTQGYVLRSPIDGEVLARGVNPGMEVSGQYAGGAPASELFTIGEIDPVWVLADAYEMQMAALKPGEKVRVSVVAYPDRAFEGTVDWVSSTIDPSTHTAKVRCTLPNPARDLKPEMFATVAIDTSAQKRLSIPRSAILHLGGKTVVYLRAGKEGDGRTRFERRPVDVAEDERGDYVPVAGGLAPTDEVVTRGAILVAGG